MSRFDTKKKAGTIVLASMMLFSLFFGAGNLIFPPILGVESGTNFLPAILGFILGGVVLPVLAIIAISITGKGIRQLSERGGKIFGFLFPIAVYLSLGAFYAIPRTATVSFSAAVPVSWQSAPWSVVAFGIVFFGITLFLAFDPSGMVDRVGKYLTPLLLILLLIMIVLSVTSLNGTPGEPVNEYATHPLTKGILTGYLTMDSLVTLAFGLVLISILKGGGFSEGPKLVGTSALVAGLSGISLALVYIGLGTIGLKMPGASNYSDGALLLSSASELTMGSIGPILFGVIVLLACLTTAAGLLGATSTFFAETFPQLSYRQWAIAFTLISFFISINGLDTVLAIAGPIIGFLYPAAITLIVLTLIEPLFHRKLYYTFRGGLIVAVIWAAMSTFQDLGFNSFDFILTLAPMDSMGLGWIVPTVIGALIGFIADLSLRPARAVPVGGEGQLAAELRNNNADTEAYTEALDESHAQNARRRTTDELDELAALREELDASRSEAQDHIDTLVQAQKDGHSQIEILKQTQSSAKDRLHDIESQYIQALENEADVIERNAAEAKKQAKELQDEAQSIRTGLDQ